MDLFTGTKIAELRKFNSLSQEGLAEKLGVSRQAVSKWERGEASPDMDNLIALARIFNISVDTLLDDRKAREITDFSKLEATQPAVDNTPETLVNPTVAAVATEIKAEETEIKEETEAEEKIPVAAEEKQPAEVKKGTEKKPKKAKKEKKIKTHYKPKIAKAMLKIPVIIIIPLIYVFIGMKLKMWSPTWLLFFILPVYYFTAFAFNAKNVRSFLLRLPVPFLLGAVFLFLGITKGMWHPAWTVFLIMPLYYWLAALKKVKKEN